MMKPHLLQTAGLAALVLLGVKALLWLVLPPRATPLPLPRAVVRHAWRVAEMRRRIHRGMSASQVRRVLGQPAYDEAYALPGDIPDAIEWRETYYGQGGPLYVAYRQSARGAQVVADVGTERVAYYGIFD